MVWHAQSKPDSSEEALKLARQVQFERFYKERGEREAELDWSRIDRAVEEVRALEAIPLAGDPIEVEPLPPERWGELAYLLDSNS